MSDDEQEQTITICNKCGRTIPKPPPLKSYEIVPLCGECLQKMLDEY